MSAGAIGDGRRRADCGELGAATRADLGRSRRGVVVAESDVLCILETAEFAADTADCGRALSGAAETVMAEARDSCTLCLAAGAAEEMGNNGIPGREGDFENEVEAADDDAAACCCGGDDETVGPDTDERRRAIECADVADDAPCDTLPEDDEECDDFGGAVDGLNEIM
jgi:hypothetical protein